MGTKTWTTTAEFNTGAISGLSTAGNELALSTGSSTILLNTGATAVSTTTKLTGRRVGQIVVPTAEITVNAVKFTWIMQILPITAGTTREIYIETFATTPTGTLAWGGSQGTYTFTASSSTGVTTFITMLNAPGIMSQGVTYFVRVDTPLSTGTPPDGWILGDINSAAYGENYAWQHDGSNWGLADWCVYTELLSVQAAATSGTWTIDVDGSAVATFSPIACNIGSTVQARIKTAVNQAGLGAAAWVPATGYYTAFPATVTAAVNQWSRLEFSLSGAETVQDITLNWAELLVGGNPSSSFGLGINRKLNL